MGENGKAEFIKIQNRLNSKEEKLAAYLKEREPDTEYNFYSAISQVFHNLHHRAKPLKRMKTLAALFNIPYPEDHSKKNLYIAFKTIALKFPKIISNKITAQLKEIPAESEGRSYEKAAAEICSFLPVELIELILKYAPQEKHFYLQKKITHFSLL